MASLRHHKFSFLIIGDTMTGKSALVQRYIHKTFKTSNDSTIGIEYEGKSIIGHPRCEADLRLALWDTAGQRAFRDLIKVYFKNGDGVILVVDLVNRSTFESLDYWLDQCNGLMRKMTPVMVIGNKLDLAGKGKREISEEEMLKFVGKYANMEYIETSALTGKNVDKAFEKLIMNVLDKLGNDGEKGSDFKKLEMELKKDRKRRRSWRRFFCCYK